MPRKILLNANMLFGEEKMHHLVCRDKHIRKWPTCIMPETQRKPLPWALRREDRQIVLMPYKGTNQLTFPKSSDNRLGNKTDLVVLFIYMPLSESKSKEGYMI